MNALKLGGSFATNLTFAVAFASTPPGGPQLYDLAGHEPGQVVMISKRPEGRTVIAFDGGAHDAHKFFPARTRVWIWCGGATSENTIRKIGNNRHLTTVDLVEKPPCKSRPWLMSNHPFPQQTWTAQPPGDEEVKAIRKKLGRGKLKVTRIETATKGAFYLVFDPAMPAVYDTGGYRLLDQNLKQIARYDGAPLVPIIDLNNDGVPEFFLPSSDGDSAWIIELYPRLNHDNSRYAKEIRRMRPPSK